MIGSEIYDILKSGPIEEKKLANKLGVDVERLSKFMLKMLRSPGQKLRHRWVDRHEKGGMTYMDSIYHTEGQ